MGDERCVHELLPGQCGICAPRTVAAAPRDAQVWWLPTSEAFHRPACPMLDGTHEANLARGIEDNPTEWGTVGAAVDAGLRPCQMCAPDVR
ncbi:MAG TPA: hypothetical protein VNA20_01475 [Frankiaceae bacterium]|nr:hypothetical protein [Frankiaceae bacterium]